MIIPCQKETYSVTVGRKGHVKLNQLIARECGDLILTYISLAIVKSSSFRLFKDSGVEELE